MKEVIDDWHYTTDPHKCLVVGDRIDNGQAKIIGFCSPAGIAPNKLMVNIEYSSGSITTRDYASILVQKIHGKTK